MKGMQRNKLRELPPDQKMYLLAQNQHLTNSTSNQSLSNRLKTSASSTSLRSSSQQKEKEQSSATKPNQQQQQQHQSPSKVPQPSPKPAPATISSGRAASYKYNNYRRLAAANNRSSKVGSMILEFDALSNQPENQDAAAWLLLDDKSITRPTPPPVTRHNQVQSLSRKEGAHLASLVESRQHQRQSLSRKEGANLAALTEQRSRNSPYYHVERLRSKYVSFFSRDACKRLTTCYKEHTH